MGPLGDTGMAASDGTLVLGVRNGDRAAFAELYDRRARLIRAICLDETRDLHAAADLCQETFLRAFRNLGSLRDPQRFAAWLAGIAKQVCREWRRSRRREQTRLQNYTNLRLADGPGTGSPGLTADDAQEALAALTDREAPSFPALSDQQRLTLHAYYAQGCNVEEARTVLGLSRSTFYRVLSSACQRLRMALAGQEVRR
ncbi:MAG: sigma-70 family RNA polymerase sigma factor [Planctomycetes bacterium]|nr:sigma-70 family RNA polymerase sigma factor [Planctomycetota bacterium]